MATGKENMPITPLANAFHGLMNRTSSPSFQPVPFALKTNFDCSSPKKEKPDAKAELLLSPTKTHASIVRDGSPNNKSPNKRSSPQKSPKARGGLKHKRLKNLKQEVQSVKDFSKLQEEVNENREKISSLQNRITTTQKEKDSISTQLQIVEDIKQQLNQQLLDKNRQLEEAQADTEELTERLSNTQKDLESNIKLVEHHSMKRARTEVVSELKTINHNQDRETLTQQLKDLQEENKKAITNLQEIATKEKEKAQEQEKTISVLQQTCEETTKKYDALKRDFFTSTCLAIKLNLSKVGRPVNIQIEELWELAEERGVPIDQFPKFITAEIRKRYDAVAVNK